MHRVGGGWQVSDHPVVNITPFYCIIHNTHATRER